MCHGQIGFWCFSDLAGILARNPSNAAVGALLTLVDHVRGAASVSASFLPCIYASVLQVGLLRRRAIPALLSFGCNALPPEQAEERNTAKDNDG